MTQEPLTLYKLIILYMLHRVTFPLTNAQISDFMLEKGYTNFLTLQQATAELKENGLIEEKTLRNRTYLITTQEGNDTLRYFENRISDAIKADVLSYLKENELELRNEASVTSDFYKTTGGSFLAELTVREKGEELITLKLSVPTKELAASVCDSWQRKNQEIYQYLTTALFS